ncbi:hypothetical protein SNEBB_003228 [Seison nebaliae]|nr:hypothetical protein SNEBB_003228 [Seison nebaliae]
MSPVRPSLISILIIVIINSTVTCSRSSNDCVGDDCQTFVGNLLVGRSNSIDTNSTCHGYYTEHLGTSKNSIKFCDENEHSIKKLIGNIGTGNSSSTWWQSKGGDRYVRIEINFEQEFSVNYIYMKFNSFAPAAIYLEKSNDYGKTWKPLRYYSDNCRAHYPQIPNRQPQSIDDVVCGTSYANEYDKSVGRELVYRTLNPLLLNRQTGDTSTNEEKEKNYEKYTKFLRTTNIRVNFQSFKTLGDEYIDPKHYLNYYYSISKLMVHGSCSCYGHAGNCVPPDGSELVPDKIYGQCRCQHNTAGNNCEKCIDGYHKLPWQPSYGSHSEKPFECERCKCNDHTTQCHFDQRLFQMSDRTDGGSCDNCRGNTDGDHCEQCLSGYYRQTNDPRQNCYECRCYIAGTISSICYSEPAPNIVSGSCRCKTNVVGENCDKCATGFYQLSADNPNGCHRCQCNRYGSTEDICDENTGRCFCRPGAQEPSCDRCKDGYYSLANGCLPCNCDMTNSYSTNCDVNGQCRCKEGRAGRRCDGPIPNYYCSYPDTYSINSQSQTYVNKEVDRYPNDFLFDREQENVAHKGYLVVKENGTEIEYMIEEIPKTMSYILVLRYKTGEENGRHMTDRHHPNYMFNVQLIKRESEDKVIDEKYIYSQNRNENMLKFRRENLEEYESYRIVIRFLSQNPMNVKVGNLIIMPAIEELMNGYEPNRCFDEFADASMRLSEDCRQKTCSVFFQYNQIPKKCECDTSGSTDLSCDAYGGQCSCKENVGQRDCSKCRFGYYGFSIDGCSSCNCDGSGSRSERCHEINGECECLDNVSGDKCAECEDGFWNFPQCLKCDCYEHATHCNKTTGVCSNCQHNTAGDHCEICQQHFYGNPTNLTDPHCRQCNCPDTFDSKIYRANSCSLIENDKIKCHCNREYEGLRCDICSPGHHYETEDDLTVCVECKCFNNIDMNNHNSCDVNSGECLNCLHHTTGFHCEKCEDGYFGNARNQSCRACQCYPIGTNLIENEQMTDCHHLSGKCNCKENVVGTHCDSCAPKHYGIYSGNGCSPCNCSIEGSIDELCDEYTGQCKCKFGFSGQQCDSCPIYTFGHAPNCEGCNCDSGAESNECDALTGQCNCREGIIGRACDRCAKGTTGDAPYCESCGECYNQWMDRLNSMEKRLVEFDKFDLKSMLPQSAKNHYDRLNSKIERLRQFSNSISISIGEVKEKLDMFKNRTDNIENEKISVGDENEKVKTAVQELEKEIGLYETQQNNLLSRMKELEESNKYLSYLNPLFAQRNADEIKNKIYEKQKKMMTDLDQHTIMLHYAPYKCDLLIIDQIISNDATNFIPTNETKIELMKLSEVVCSSSNLTSIHCPSIDHRCGALKCSCGNIDDVDACTNSLPYQIARLKAMNKETKIEDILSDLQHLHQRHSDLNENIKDKLMEISKPNGRIDKVRKNLKNYENRTNLLKEDIKEQNGRILKQIQIDTFDKENVEEINSIKSLQENFMEKSKDEQQFKVTISEETEHLSHNSQLKNDESITKLNQINTDQNRLDTLILLHQSAKDQYADNSNTTKFLNRSPSMEPINLQIMDLQETAQGHMHKVQRLQSNIAKIKYVSNNNRNKNNNLQSVLGNKKDITSMDVDFEKWNETMKEIKENPINLKFVEVQNEYEQVKKEYDVNLAHYHEVLTAYDDSRNSMLDHQSKLKELMDRAERATLTIKRGVKFANCEA